MLRLQTAAAMAVTLFAAQTNADLVDGSFESADPFGYAFFQGGIDTPWQTTAPDNLIEIWNGNNMGVVPYDGTNFAELNANYASALFQDINGLGDFNAINWHFAHRGRDGYDVMQLTITDLGTNQTYDGGLVDDTILFQQQFGADNLGWQFHYGTITSIGNLTRFSFEAISAVGGNTQGNFIDYAGFGQTAVPGPSALAILGLGIGLLRSRRRI